MLTYDYNKIIKREKYPRMKKGDIKKGIIM